MSACRFCDAPLKLVLADLGMQPLSNNFIKAGEADRKEPFFPLRVLVCESCFLAQVEGDRPPEEIFTEYAYFSSYSKSWLKHSRRLAEAMMDRFDLGERSQVIEIASNDGYLLRNFQERGIPILGIEPAQNVARVAQEAGIPTRSVFFGKKTAEGLKGEGIQAHLLIGINVFAHVPDINDFVRGMKTVLAENGVVVLEFPHLLRLIEDNQFDTIYHEHFSYFSLNTAQRILAAHGLAVFSVEEYPTHGGSLRIFAGHTGDGRKTDGAVENLLSRERAFGLLNPRTYESFAGRIQETRRSLRGLLAGLRAQGKSIVGYGAPAKGNTLLNFCGVGNDLLDYTVDRNPYKQGRLTPGMRIPILAPEKIAETKPDYVLVLPWNLREEIVAQLDYVSGWGGRFIFPIPAVEVAP